MREIKFRAWDNRQNNMFKDCLDIQKCIVWFVTDETARDKDLSWMQYTGIKDKNGKEIYEGDIIKDGWLKNNPLEVVEWSGTGWEPFADHAITDEYDPNTIEVIGNIYENKELLK